MSCSNVCEIQSVDSQKIDMKREKDGNYSIIKDYGNGIECEIKYENHIKVQEGWSLDGEEHRDNGLPA